jgi:uncharacterized protein
MRRSFQFPACLLLCCVSLLLVISGAGASLPAPRLTGYVNDYAEILSAGERASIQATLQNFEARTGNQVVVLTVPSLEGDSLEAFSIRVAEAWKIGKKGQDNGVIFLVAPRDRKVRIEVGYGLEGVLTDAECDRIIRRQVVPRFQQGDYYAGISEGLTGVLSVIQGTSEAPASSPESRPGMGGRTRASGFLIFMLFVFVFLTRLGRLFVPLGLLGGMMWGGGRSSRRFGSGGFGGFGGGGGGGFGGGGASGSW